MTVSGFLYVRARALVYNPFAIYPIFLIDTYTFLVVGRHYYDRITSRINCPLVVVLSAECDRTLLIGTVIKYYSQ